LRFLGGGTVPRRKTLQAELDIRPPLVGAIETA
jgi:hypothetical protein